MIPVISARLLTDLDVRPADQMKSILPLSVVIPTWNTRELTLRCLAALSRDDAVEEVIVIDDASSDGTPEAIRRAYPHVRVLRNQENAGFGASANRGLATARAKVTLLLNSDTKVMPGSLRALSAVFDDPHIGIAGAQLYEPNGRKQWSAGRLPTPVWLFALTSGIGGATGKLRTPRTLASAGRSAERVQWVTGAAMAIRKETLDNIGFFDETFLFYAQDLDLCVRAASARWGVVLVTAAGVIHDRGGTIAPHESDRSDPALLWRDLLHWAAKHDRQSAPVNYRWMRRGATLRIAARQLLWRDEETTRRYSLAREALDEYARTMLP